MSRQDLCLVLGNIEFNRLALLLFDRTEHVVVHEKEEALDEFVDFVKNLLGQSSERWPETTYTKTRPGVWNVEPGDGVKMDLFYPSWIQEEGEAPEEQPLITIGRLPVIEPAQLTNELVAEFREDSESRVKLQRLRAWVHQEYVGKPAAFIQDDLETRIFDYHLAAKKWGLRTVESAFTISAADKVLSGACAGLVTALVGVPVAEAVAVGMLATIGAVAVKIGTGRRHLSLSQSQDPVAYIAEVRKASNEGS